MFASLLTPVLAAAGLYAVLVIVGSALRHGKAALAMGRTLAACPEMRGFTYRIVSHDFAWKPQAQVVPFPARVRFSPGPQPLRAAA